MFYTSIAPATHSADLRATSPEDAADLLRLALTSGIPALRGSAETALARMVARRNEVIHDLPLNAEAEAERVLLSRSVRMLIEHGDYLAVWAAGYSLADARKIHAAGFDGGTLCEGATFSGNRAKSYPWALAVADAAAMSPRYRRGSARAFKPEPCEKCSALVEAQRDRTVATLADTIAEAIVTNVGAVIRRTERKVAEIDQFVARARGVEEVQA